MTIKSARRRAFDIVNQTRSDDWVSRICARFLSGLIVLNVIAISLESVPRLSQQYQGAFWLFEIASLIIFSIEYLVRIWSARDNHQSRHPSPFGRRAAYMFSFTGLIDLLAILPSLLPLLFGPVDLRWLRVLRLLRLLKMSHYSSALEDLAAAIWSERRAFGAALYLFSIALFGSSALLYLVENQAQPDHFSSIPATMWWSLITLTTIGYGDVVPITVVGKLLGAFTAMMGIGSVALLTGVVATAFANQVSEREDVLKAEVIKALHDGVISGDEMEKIRQLQHNLGLSDEHAVAMINLLRREYEKR